MFPAENAFRALPWYEELLAPYWETLGDSGPSKMEGRTAAGRPTPSWLPLLMFGEAEVSRRQTGSNFSRKGSFPNRNFRYRELIIVRKP
jgi:hypothetical protein